jgi:hypothetical protein
MFKPTVFKLNSVSGRVGEIIEKKVHSILSKTPGCEQICEVKELSAGKRNELPSKNY